MTSQEFWFECDPFQKRIPCWQHAADMHGAINCWLQKRK